MTTIKDLAQVIPKAWLPRINTTPGELLVQNEPSIGQCAITSLVLQDYLGGEIVNAIATRPGFPGISASHYFNIIDGKEVDLTRQQFKKDVVFSEPKPKTKDFKTTRDYILSYPDTVQRYELLRSRVKVLLGQ